MKFQVEFDCHNAAFEPDARVAISNVLAEISSDITKTNSMSGKVCDYNGNVVGSWKIVGY